MARISTGCAFVYLLWIAAHAQANPGLFLIDSNDCQTLVSWPAFATLPGAPATCVQVPCNTVPGATCDYRTGRLTRLDMSSRGLSGALPEQWGALTNLSELSLKDNRLVGAVPATWGSLISLTHLDLSGNQLTGPLPKAWSSTKFTLLDLRGTQLVIADAQPAQPGAPSTPTATQGNTTAGRGCGSGSGAGACGEGRQAVKHRNIESAATIAAIAAASGLVVALACAAVALYRWHSKRKAKQAKGAQLPVYQARLVASSHEGVHYLSSAPVGPASTIMKI